MDTSSSSDGHVVDPSLKNAQVLMIYVLYYVSFSNFTYLTSRLQLFEIWKQNTTINLLWFVLALNMGSTFEHVIMIFQTKLYVWLMTVDWIVSCVLLKNAYIMQHSNRYFRPLQKWLILHFGINLDLAL